MSGRFRLERAFGEAMRTAMRPATLLLAVNYVLVSIYHLVAGDPASDGALPLTATTAVVCVLGYVLLRKPLSWRATGPLSFVLGALVLANVGFYYALDAQVTSVGNFFLLQFAAAALIIWRSWLIALSVAILVVWAVLSAVYVPDVDWTRDSLLMLSMVVLGGLIHVVRRSALVRTEDARHEAEQARAEVEQSLARAEETHERAQRSEQSLRELIDRHPDGIVVHSSDGEILFANRAFAELLRLPASDLCGRDIVELVEREDRRRLRRRLTGSTTLTREQYVFLRADRESVVLSLDVPRPVTFEGQSAAMLAARDVTSSDRQQQARLQLADRMAAVGTLAAGVAHEINNPLTYVLTNLDELTAALARADSLPDREHLLALAKEAHEGAERVRHLSRDLKLVSRHDPEESVAEEPPTLPNDAVHSALRVAGNSVRHRADIRLDLGEAPVVDVSHARLSQVVLNLLLNASEAFEHAMLSEREEGPRIDVATRRTSDEAVIVVTDNGPGIPREHLREIFHPFFTTKPAGVGTGLGLSFCHNVVVGAGGRIEVDTKVGEGTRFSVFLPASSRQRATPTVERSGPSEVAESLRILVVDDEEGVARALQRLLKGHDVELCFNGADALARLEEASFDVVLADLMMPGVTGIDIHDTLVDENAALADAVVFVTGGAFTKTGRSFLAATSNLVLEKPFRNSDVHRAVHEAAQRGRARQFNLRRQP